MHGELSALLTHGINAFDLQQNGSALIGWDRDYADSRQRLRNWVSARGTQLDRDRPTHKMIWPRKDEVTPIEKSPIENSYEDFVAFVMVDVERRREIKHDFDASPNANISKVAGTSEGHSWGQATQLDLMLMPFSSGGGTGKTKGTGDITSAESLSSAEMAGGAGQPARVSPSHQGVVTWEDSVMLQLIWDTRIHIRNGRTYSTEAPTCRRAVIPVGHTSDRWFSCGRAHAMCSMSEAHNKVKMLNDERNKPTRKEETC